MWSRISAHREQSADKVGIFFELSTRALRTGVSASSPPTLLWGNQVWETSSPSPFPSHSSQHRAVRRGRASSEGCGKMKFLFSSWPRN